MALSLRSVSASFGGVAALDAVTFDLPEHHVGAVVGPNGAGKTTLLNAINGLLGNRLRGQVELFGRHIEGLSPASVAKRKVARSFQDPPLVESASVLDNVLLGAHTAMGSSLARRLGRATGTRAGEHEWIGRAIAVLDTCSLADVAGQAAGSLPYGDRKLVDIARAMAGEPDLLLLDEPTSGLDSAEQARVESMIEAMRSAQNVTVLVVEHRMDMVRRVATTVVGMEAGRVTAVGSPRDVLDSAEFRRSLVGRSDDEVTAASADQSRPAVTE
jgi:branched-chain amino acid transport system ATP-binding protein